MPTYVGTFESNFNEGFLLSVHYQATPSPSIGESTYRRIIWRLAVAVSMQPS